MLDHTDFANPEYLVLRGWKYWSEDELFDDGSGVKKPLLLCPLTDFDNVSPGSVMYSIVGTKAVKGVDEIDDDTRGGLMAFGVLVDNIVHPDRKKKYRSIDDPSELNSDKTV